MKKFFALLSAVLALSACAHEQGCSEEVYDEPCPCEEAPAPAPAPVIEQPCGTCQGEVRTVREPVEVVYRRRTYGTVYEPRYFENVSYERQNLDGAYYQQEVVIETADDVVPVPAPRQVVAPVVNAPAPAPAPARRHSVPVVLVPAQ